MYSGSMKQGTRVYPLIGESLIYAISKVVLEAIFSI